MTVSSSEWLGSQAGHTEPCVSQGQSSRCCPALPLTAEHGAQPILGLESQLQLLVPGLPAESPLPQPPPFVCDPHPREGGSAGPEEQRTGPLG